MGATERTRTFVSGVIATLAHGGALFLHELAEFSPSVLETQCEPLEEGAVTISRAGTAATYPARFTLVALVVLLATATM